VLVIHLRHYSTVTQTITSQNRSLTRTQLQQAIDYIQTHLNRDLSRLNWQVHQYQPNLLREFVQTGDGFRRISM